MKIAHIVSYYNSAYKYQEYYLAAQQAKDGHEVYIITSDRNYPFIDYNNTARSAFGPRRLKPGCSMENGVHIIRLSLILEYRTRVILKSFRKTIRHLSPEVLIIHGLMNFAALSLLYCNINAKLIFDDHMLISQVDRSLIGKMIYMIYRVFITPQIIKKATKVVAISEGCIPILNQFFGIPLDRISLIPLGADDNLFSYSDKKRIEIRNRHVINLDSIVVIFTGKLIKRKGLEKISEALEIIDSEKKIHILIVGSGSEEYKRELINTFNSRNHSFTIHPFVSSEELVGYFCAADIAVYPVEATISTVEASSCSLPIICTNEIPERYKNGNGFGIEPGNIKQLKEALFILIEDEELRKKMGRKGRELVENELSWSKVSNNFLSSIEH